MRKMSVIPLLLLLLLLLLLVADGRVIGDDPSSSVDRTVGAAETCEQPYGFLPCSSSFTGTLFLVMLYDVLLCLGSLFVSIGSNLFVEMIGSSIIRSNLFQLLGTIPHIVIILVSLLSGSKEAAQGRATMTMGSVGGSTIMTLTCLVGVCILYGRDETSEATSIDKSGSDKIELMDASAGDGVTTDVKTRYTALVMLIPLIPFLIILAAEAFGSSPVNRVLHLVALIVSVILLFSFILYQGFYPWIRLHVFEYLMSKYANGKLPRLLSKNGRPDTMKIQDLFNKINKDGSESVSAAELQVLLSAVKMEEGDLSTDRDVESILESFDLTNDGRINQEAFVRGMDKLLSEITEERLNRIKRSRSSNSQDNEQLQESLLASSSSANSSRNPSARYYCVHR